MEGYGDAIGVSPRAINELFQQINGSLASEWTYQISMSMLEIYNETIQDLLSPSKEKLDVRQSNEGNVVVGLTDIPVS
jgi:hypothetical protein